MINGSGVLDFVFLKYCNYVKLCSWNEAWIVIHADLVGEFLFGFG
jgi:hypothetical protein